MPAELVRAGPSYLLRTLENTASDTIDMTACQMDRPNNLEPAAGARYNDANMASIDQWCQ